MAQSVRTREGKPNCSRFSQRSGVIVVVGLVAVTNCRPISPEASTSVLPAADRGLEVEFHVAKDGLDTIWNGIGDVRSK
jgi:hypothetical protein